MPTMTCPDCGEDLDLVAPGEACPGCGGSRRMTVVSAPAASGVGAAAAASSIVGHHKFPTWHTLWAQINRRVSRLEGIYAGTQNVENTGDLEDEVDALLVCIAHLRDWLLADAAFGKALRRPIGRLISQDPLRLCGDYANSFKHHTYFVARQQRGWRSILAKRKQRPRRYARLDETLSSPGGHAVSLQSWMDDGSGQDQSVDALTFAQECIEEWRSFFARRGITDPQPL
ncbi:MAG: hypothetical protein WB797_15895 [Nocardioides sp.]